MRKAPLLALTLCAASAACLPRATIPDGERERASRELEGQRRILEVAVHVGPFFGDASKLLVSDQPFDELDLLHAIDGGVILPRAERVLPPGTRVRIEKVEFPTGMLIASRVMMTPRYHPWVYLAVEGEKRPLVMVLPQTIERTEDVRLELDRILGASDPAPLLERLPEDQRVAISHKELLEGMAPQTVVLSWGQPERRIVDRPAAKEEWSWASGKRRAWFEGDRLVRFERARPRAAIPGRPADRA